MTVEHIPDSIVLGPGEGEHFEFLDNLATVKLTGRHRSMSVVEFLAPRGFGPPEHRHNEEDELFIVFEGKLRLFTGGSGVTAEAGAFAYLPHAIPHTFQVLSPTARFLNVTASITTTPRFDEMVAALGTPTSVVDLPEPTYVDAGRVAEVCAAHGIDIVGPPLPPLPDPS